MNKADLIAAIAGKSGMTKTDCTRVVDTLLDAIADNIGQDGGVAIAGFGTFKTTERKARTARNPATGAEVQVPAKAVPVFKAAKGLKDAVKGISK